MNGQQERLTHEEFQAALQRLDGLVQEFEQLPLQRVQEKVFGLLQAVDSVHREGLSRLVSRLREEGGDEVVQQLADDPVIHTLLLLYDLAPEGSVWDEIPEESKAPPSPEPRPTSSNVIGLDQIRFNGRQSATLREPRFTTVAEVEDVPPGTMQPAAVGEARIMVVNVGGDLYAVGEVCPGGDLSLLFGELEGTLVTCSWHGEVYDVRSGRCVDAADREDAPRLPVYPLRVVDGQIQIAATTAAAEGDES